MYWDATDLYVLRCYRLLNDILNPLPFVDDLISLSIQQTTGIHGNLFQFGILCQTTGIAREWGRSHITLEVQGGGGGVYDYGNKCVCYYLLIRQDNYGGVGDSITLAKYENDP